MWRFLRHPNVLSLIGASISETQFAMASEWMPNGNINQFIKAHPEVNRLGLVRVLFVTFFSLVLRAENSLAGGCR